MKIISTTVGLLLYSFVRLFLLRILSCRVLLHERQVMDEEDEASSASLFTKAQKALYYRA